jgi:hypothetical protein
VDRIRGSSTQWRGRCFFQWTNLNSQLKKIYVFATFTVNINPQNHFQVTAWNIWQFQTPNSNVCSKIQLMISLINHWRLAECSWLQYGHLHAFNSTQEWIAQHENETGFRIGTRWWASEIGQYPIRNPSSYWSSSQKKCHCLR